MPHNGYSTTLHCRQGETLQRTDLREGAAITQQQRTHSETPLEDQAQDSTGPLPNITITLSSRNITGFPNNDTKNQQPRQNNKVVDFTLKERAGKSNTRDLVNTEISKMPEPEFKTMIIRILAGLEKNIQDT